ncbi:hypothetical protein PIB30_076577 [Stylosanthes scabra]|uniref:Putative plant transposon protein domain-containing protein n=1 Tax=Stylosanthes scabra TaxID=79078 RepID=A0ABU6VQD0_9FABA|nr:hypothetical protein [Stylosanthes scabra]
MEHRGITHERIIHFSDREPDFMLDRVEGLGWGFMYNAFPPINVTMVREFCNFSADHQTHVFLRGRRIPFSEEDIRHHLGIAIDLPPLGEDDMFKAREAARKRGELDMDLVFQANNPADNTVPERKIDNVILNAQATAWHKLIIANIDSKQHGTTFDLDHAILVYVLMTEGVVNLPRIMRDVPKFPRDEIYHVREQDMYRSYGDWKDEQPKVCRGTPAPQEEQPPPSPPPQPVASEIPYSSVRRPPEPSLQEVMRYLRRQERLQLNTQFMLQDAFPDITFRNLLPVTSSEDDSDPES